MGAPVLDNQFFGHNVLVKQYPENFEDVKLTAKDILNSIAERDIYTGDNIEFVLINSNGV